MMRYDDGLMLKEVDSRRNDKEMYDDDDQGF